MDAYATEQYIRESAQARGIDPDVAVNVARSEGLNSYIGDEGSSFGPFQLHYGGMAPGGNAVSGLGDVFTAQTGLHANDPTTIPQQIDFALDHAAQNGWDAWHGWKGDRYAGIGSAVPPSAYGTDKDPLMQKYQKMDKGGESWYGTDKDPLMQKYAKPAGPPNQLAQSQRGGEGPAMPNDAIRDPSSPALEILAGLAGAGVYPAAAATMWGLAKPAAKFILPRLATGALTASGALGAAKLLGIDEGTLMHLLGKSSGSLMDLVKSK